MSENPYTPPVAALEGATAGSDDIDAEFYIVSTRKFLLLFVATFGLYVLYWQYKQWSQSRRFHNENIWPVARAIFSIFFTHKLTSRVDDRLRDNGTTYTWSPSNLATAYVLLAIFSNATNRLPDSPNPWLNLLPLFLQMAIAWPLLHIQRAINMACDQPNGESNARITGANWFWLVLGAVGWLLILIGLFMPDPS